MEQFSSIQTFIDSYNINEKISKELGELISFTTYSNEDRNTDSKTINKSINNDREYMFNYNNKQYPFEIFSNYDLQQFDKDILLDLDKRENEQLYRTLKLACSRDLINPRISIIKSLTTQFGSIILFEENGHDKVIDYSKNIVMDKRDYYEIFEIKEINVVDKFDLYNIYYMMTELDDYAHFFEYLVFTKEIFNELSKKGYFKFLYKNCDDIGINYHNYTILGDNCDCLFFTKRDYLNSKYGSIIKELEIFTKNPSIYSENISYNNQKNMYQLRKDNYGIFDFLLLSDIISDEKIRKQLLSNNRYGYCHDNSLRITGFLSKKYKSTCVVGGKCKLNERDYYYHSWVEIEEDNSNPIVIDYNENLIIDRDKYYELFEAIAISKTNVSEITEIIQTLISDAKIFISPLEINYFGTDILRDLKKNPQLFSKKLTK